MHRRFALASLFLLLAACGDPQAPAAPPAAPPSTAPAGPSALEGAAGARATVEAYLVAAKVPDEAAMLALGTPAWRERETTWKKAFTRNIVKAGFALKAWEVREPEVEGDRASVSVRATFSDQGRDDPEGMRFSLERRDGRWWITELH
jgi:hypothetical protein